MQFVRQSIRAPGHAAPVGSPGPAPTRVAAADVPTRHTEDGCPKRFELGVREDFVAAPARWGLPHLHESHRGYGAGVPPSATVPLSSSADGS